MVEHTRLINGVKYIKFFNSRELKKKSLEDNVYFNIRDIFLNYGCIEDIFRANNYNSKLTNNICYEERTPNFEYTNLLMDKTFLLSLIKWMKTINILYFEFETPEQYMKNYDTNSKDYLEELDSYYNVDMNEYIPLDNWMDEFKELIKELEIQLKNLQIE